MKVPHVVLALCLVVTSMCGYVFAESNTGQVQGQPPKESGNNSPPQEMWNIYQKLEAMLKEVSLTEAQQKDITGVMQAEKSRVALIQKRIEENWNDLMRTSFAAQYNQARYDQLVEKLSGLYKQLIDEHGKMMRDINAMLTNEQREKVLKQIPRKRRPQQSSGFGFDLGFGF